MRDEHRELREEGPPVLFGLLSCGGHAHDYVAEKGHWSSGRHPPEVPFLHREC